MKQRDFNPNKLLIITRRSQFWAEISHLKITLIIKLKRNRVSKSKNNKLYNRPLLVSIKLILAHVVHDLGKLAVRPSEGVLVRLDARLVLLVQLQRTKSSILIEVRYAVDLVASAPADILQHDLGLGHELVPSSRCLAGP